MKQIITITVDIPEESLSTLVKTLGAVCAVESAETRVDVNDVCEEQSKKLAELCIKCAKLEQQSEALNGMLRTVTHFRDEWKEKAIERLTEISMLKEKAKTALADKDKIILKKDSIIADLIGTLKSESSYLAKTASTAHEANQK